MRTPSSKARKCPACGRAMKKNGRTGKGTQRWRCRACRLSSTMPQRGRRRARTLEEFLSWLPGRRPRRRRNPRATRAPCASGSHGAGQSGRASPAGREAPHGHGRRHVHGPRLVPDYRHRRRERRSPRLPVVRARVQGRLPGPVLRDPHARRADHRWAARRGGGVPGGVARHPDPSPSGACATQHPHRPDLQTPTPGRQGIEKLSGLLTGVETAEEAVGWGEALNA